MRVNKFIQTILVAFLVLSYSLPLLGAPTSSKELTNPMAIAIAIDQIEDSLEKNYDKQFGVDWDFELYYNQNKNKAFMALEYDRDDTKTFNAIPKTDLEKLIIDISTKITTALGIPSLLIEGIIIEDDAQSPAYTFTYQDGKLDIK